MSNLTDIGRLAIKTIEIEADAIKKMALYIDSDFEQTVQMLYDCKGRIIISGIGKSAIIANKIVATLNSTGTPAVFMHAADAIHGDLGIVQPDDIVICISKSGSTPEIKVLVPLIRNMGNKLIAMVSNMESYLAQQADCVLRTSVDEEACPNNLAPTSSTTAQLVMGDALAICLLKLRGFTAQDFARVHPGGALGKKLYIRVDDIVDRTRAPKVLVTETIHNTIITISTGRLGATVVVDEKNTIVGIITDGDVRRMIEKNANFTTLKAQDIMICAPKQIEADELAIKAVAIMEKNEISQLVATQGGEYIGMIHIHDILREGIV